jgi:hypothetical protein
VNIEYAEVHVHKGQGKIGFNFFPDFGSDLWKKYYVWVPVLPPEGYQGEEGDYNKWLDSLPHIWRLNPALTCFFWVKDTTSPVEIEDHLRQTFNPDVIATIENIMLMEGHESAHHISPYLRDKYKIHPSDLVDNEKFVADINQRFGKLLVLNMPGGGKAEIVKPESIDAGSAAIDRTSYQQNGTMLGIFNPTEANGNMDTFQIFCPIAFTSAKVGMFYLVSGSNYAPRDSESVSNGTGSPRTITGLTVSATLGDYPGVYCTGYIDRDAVNGGNTGEKSGLYAGDATDGEHTYTVTDKRNISIYATGTESIKTQAVGDGTITPTGALSTIYRAHISVGGGSITSTGTLDEVPKYKLSVGNGIVGVTGSLRKKTFISVGGGNVAISGSLKASLIGAVRGMKHILKLILFHY